LACAPSSRTSLSSQRWLSGSQLGDVAVVLLMCSTRPACLIRRLCSSRFAVAPLAEADPVHRTLRPTAALPASSPNFDAMDTPEPAVTLKLRDGVAGGARPTATEQP